MRAAVIGGGSWGTALASVLGNNGHDTLIWCHDKEVPAQINERHINEKFLPGLVLPDTVTATTELAESLRGAELVGGGEPLARDANRDARSGAAPAAEHADRLREQGHRERVIADDARGARGGAARLSCIPICRSSPGPSFAKETVQKMPTAVVVAATWERVAKQVQRHFSNDYFRCYTSNDVMGVELGGALKNVCAIGAGMSDGMGFGNNSPRTVDDPRAL